MRKAGEGSVRTDGYLMYEVGGRSVLRHRLIAERALGKPLPKGAEIHHVDGDRGNDDTSNLVICPSRAYHQLLHRRQRALDACGHADWRMCQLCKQWGPESELRIYKSGNKWHPSCIQQSERDRHGNPVSTGNQIQR